jgi:hypothetical protein
MDVRTMGCETAGGRERRSRTTVCQAPERARRRADRRTLGAKHPFFSADGEWLAFFAGNTLLSVSIAGGGTALSATFQV